MKRLSILAMALATLCACGAPEPLPPKSAQVPVGIDLSGQWQARTGSDDAAQQITEVTRRAAGSGEIPLSPSSRSSRTAKAPDYQVHVFLETGAALKITQTDFGLFISFDRAIVEEYRFGEQRTVSVGPVNAERVSGWEDDRYIIETRDEEGAMLIETYRLENPDSLIRTMRINYKGRNELDVRQVFDRA